MKHIPTDRPTHRRRMAAGALALAALLGACGAVAERGAEPAVQQAGAGPEIRDYAGRLAPIRLPKARDWRDMRVVSLTDGAESTMRVGPLGAGVRVRQGDGCVWTRAADWFSPSDSWESCGGSKNWRTGTAKVTELASIWPLRPGAEGRYRRVATSATGRTYERETVCQVRGAREVLREGRAPTPAYEVACEDGKRTRTTWYAPGEGPIAFRVVHAENGVEEAWVRRS
jgi:hypothetical protein